MSESLKAGTVDEPDGSERAAKLFQRRRRPVGQMKNRLAAMEKVCSFNPDAMRVDLRLIAVKSLEWRSAFVSRLSSTRCQGLTEFGRAGDFAKAADLFASSSLSFQAQCKVLSSNPTNS